MVCGGVFACTYRCIVVTSPSFFLLMTTVLLFGSLLPTVTFWILNVSSMRLQYLVQIRVFKTCLCCSCSLSVQVYGSDVWDIAIRKIFYAYTHKRNDLKFFVCVIFMARSLDLRAQAIAGSLSELILFYFPWAYFLIIFCFLQLGLRYLSYC